jgi:hypothetical protein
MLREARNNTRRIKTLMMLLLGICIGMVIEIGIGQGKILDRLDIIEGIISK